MRTTFFVYLLSSCLLLSFATNLQAQQLSTEKQKIVSSITNYFELDRETIHLHLDKNVFVSNEAVWFKGYVFDRKNNFPYTSTTNVFATLHNQNGDQLEQQLLICYTGIFTGKFALNKTYKSGTYYIRVYTNYMNNFKEDESSVFKITIINENDDNFQMPNKPNYAGINMDFFPEGGNLIAGTTNSVGVKISDCSGNPIAANQIEIVNAKGEVIKNVLINKFGNGKFNFIPTRETYKAVLNIAGQRYENRIPTVSQKGICLETNSYTVPQKTLIKIRTNSQSIADYADKPLLLIIQQDDKTALFDINFSNKELEQELVFSNDYLTTGTNILRIVDSNLNQLAERLVFKYPTEQPDLSLEVSAKNSGNIVLSGKLNYAESAISASVLPGNSIANTDLDDIYGSFLLNTYLKEKINSASYYLNEPSRSKQYELDLALLNQKSSKYEWSNIMGEAPKATIAFEKGLGLKGTVNQDLKDRKNYRIRAFSTLPYLNESSTINEKNEFYFSDLKLMDSSAVNFSLVKTSDPKDLDLKIYPQVLGIKKSLKHFFRPSVSSCAISASSNDLTRLELPNLRKKMVTLEEVEVKSGSNLTRNRLGNANLHGYKIDADYGSQDLLLFIQTHGFKVQYNATSVAITGKYKSSINGGLSTPVIYINERRILSQDELLGMRMDEVDEIYMDANAIVPTVRNNMGVIKIYLKKLNYTGRKDRSKTFTIDGGYKMPPTFKNISYLSTEDQGFINFGIINWIPIMVTRNDGSFNFQIPNTNTPTAKVTIEGFTADGKLISQQKTIKLY